MRPSPTLFIIFPCYREGGGDRERVVIVTCQQSRAGDKVSM